MAAKFRRGVAAMSRRNFRSRAIRHRRHPAAADVVRRMVLILAVVAARGAAGGVRCCDAAPLRIRRSHRRKGVLGARRSSRKPPKWNHEHEEPRLLEEIDSHEDDLEEESAYDDAAENIMDDDADLPPVTPLPEVHSIEPDFSTPTSPSSPIRTRGCGDGRCGGSGDYYFNLAPPQSLQCHLCGGSTRWNGAFAAPTATRR